MKSFALIAGTIAQFAYAGSATATEASPKVQSTDLSKWRLSLSAVLTSADIRVVESNVIVPEESLLSGLNIETTDKLTITGNAMTASLAYRPIPIAEFSVRAGLVSSEINTAMRVTGEFQGPFDLFSGPIDIETEVGREVDGYTLGVGFNGIAPIAKLHSRGLALTTGFLTTRNSLSDGEVGSTAARATIGLAYPVDRNSANDRVYSIGASYNWLEREVNQTARVNGSELSLSLVQEYVEPWSLDAGVRIPLNERVGLSFAVSQSMSGATSGFFSIGFQMAEQNK